MPNNFFISKFCAFFSDNPLLRCLVSPQAVKSATIVKSRPQVPYFNKFFYELVEVIIAPLKSYLLFFYSSDLRELMYWRMSCVAPGCKIGYGSRPLPPGESSYFCLKLWTKWCHRGKAREGSFFETTGNLFSKPSQYRCLKKSQLQYAVEIYMTQNLNYYGALIPNIWILYVFEYKTFRSLDLEWFSIEILGTIAIVPNILKLNQYIGILDGRLFGYICNGVAVWIYNGICVPNHSTS